ncbi:dienelactone hydrolase family protein [Streptomyces althioticus]|uniref:dienelactone hydrolase family protein n=1 Tax=Streptomyces althioticus TaxID=83380 RepID=UPI00378B9138
MTSLPGPPGLLDALKGDLTFPLAWGTSPVRDPARWRRTARAAVEDALLVPAEPALPYDPSYLTGPEADAYTRESVTVTLTRRTRARGVLLTPHGAGPFPAVLLLHDHGSRFDIGKEKCVRPWYDETRLASAEEWAARHLDGRFPGDELARRGYVVLCFDALGWGERGPLVYEEQQALASALYQLGSSLAGLHAREDQRAAAFLAGLDRVDARRVAAAGWSMGGYRAWQAAASSDHVTAAASVCWMSGLKQLLVPGNNILRGQSAFHMLHPGLARHLDLPDVAGIAAPKPMLFLQGGRDPHFPADGVRAAFDRLRTVWRAWDAEERLRLRVRPERGHTFDSPMQDETYAWLDSVLRA